jgi:hypothetical protein
MGSGGNSHHKEKKSVSIIAESKQAKAFIKKWKTETYYKLA